MKRILALTAAAVTALTVTATSTVVQAQTPKELAIGSLAPNGSPWRKLLEEAEDRIEAETNGSINVILRPAGFMGEVEMVQETRSGERLQGCGATAGAISQGGNIPTLQLLELPFLFNNNAEADYVLDNLFDDFSKTLERRGFVMAIWSENGWRSFGTREKAIRTPADLKGLKMRSQESDAHMAMYNTYGAVAVQKPMTEVLPALNSNVIDGLDNTALFMQAGGLAEPLSYFTLSRHIYQPAAIIWSKKFYDGLTDNEKQALASVKDLGPKGRKMIRAEEGVMMDNWQYFGVEVIELSGAERQAFVKPARAMHDSFAAKIDGGPAMLSKIRKHLAVKR